MTAPALERRLATLLSSGTWIASAVIAVGLVRSEQIVTVGLALFIALPVLRVIVMAGWYLRGRDLRFAAICGVVLTLLLAGFALGAR
jgi:uncharacterized membrane protein